MIVFEKKQIVIVTPPHTGSGSLHRVCHAMGAHWVIGPTPDGAGFDHHCAIVGNAWKDYKIALVVRDPVERLVGLYYHYQWWCLSRGEEPLTLDDYVLHLDDVDDLYLSWFYRYTIARLMSTSRFEEVLRYENLASDVSRLLGTTIVLPPKKIEHPPACFVWSADLSQAAKRWIEDDSQLGRRCD